MNQTVVPTELQKFLNVADDGVFYIGHASALVRLAGQLILLDPVWNHRPYGDYWTFYPPQIDCQEVLDRRNVATTIISHIHEDHVCDRIVGQVDRIDIMNGRPELVGRLFSAMPKGVGACTTAHHPWTWIDLVDDVEVLFVPHAFNSVDSSCFLRNKRTGFTVYHGNDNFLNTEALHRLKNLVPAVDVAMVPYAFIHWYPFLMTMDEEKKQREIQRLNQQSLDQAWQFCNFMRPRATIPFGASMFYADTPEHPLNRDLVTPFAFPHPSGVPLNPGGMIVNIQGQEGLLIRGQMTPGGFSEGLRQHLTAVKRPSVHTDGQVLHPGSFLQDIQSRVDRARADGWRPLDGHMLVVNGIQVNLKTLEVRPKSQDMKLRPPFETVFTFNRREYGQWLRGEITFEQAIGTRRFRCVRRPDVYEPRVFDFMNRYL